MIDHDALGWHLDRFELKAQRSDVPIDRWITDVAQPREREVVFAGQAGPVFDGSTPSDSIAARDAIEVS